MARILREKAYTALFDFVMHHIGYKFKAENVGFGAIYKIREPGFFKKTLFVVHSDYYIRVTDAGYLHETLPDLMQTVRRYEELTGQDITIRMPDEQVNLLEE